MSYVTTKQMLLDAQKGGYAVGAFNFENMEMALAIITTKKPCFLHRSVIKFRVRECLNFCRFLSGNPEKSVTKGA